MTPGLHVDNIYDIRGFAGLNTGLISTAYATGAVKTGYGSDGSGGVGGFVGTNSGLIASAFALGDVAADRKSYGVGGFVGDNSGQITQTYAAGAVAGVAMVGAFAGVNGGSAQTFYWGTTVTGGLPGAASNTGSFATSGLTTAQLQSGALPSGFDPATWGAAPGAYPYLKGLPKP